MSIIVELIKLISTLFEEFAYNYFKIFLIHTYTIKIIEIGKREEDTSRKVNGGDIWK